MTRPSGRRAQQLLRYILTRDRGICWLCNHTGADTMDHVLPYASRPDLAWDVRNLKAAHGERRTISSHGYECVGNYARQDEAPPTNATRSRQW